MRKAMNEHPRFPFFTRKIDRRSFQAVLITGLFLLGMTLGGIPAARAQSAACNGDLNCLGPGGRCKDGACTCPLGQNCTWFQCPSGFTIATLTQLRNTVARCTRRVRYGFAVCKPGSGGRNYVARRGLDICTDASGQRSFPAFCMKGKLFIDADGQRDDCSETLVRPPNRATLTVQ